MFIILWRRACYLIIRLTLGELFFRHCNILESALELLSTILSEFELLQVLKHAMPLMKRTTIYVSKVSGVIRIPKLKVNLNSFKVFENAVSICIIVSNTMNGKRSLVCIVRIMIKQMCCSQGRYSSYMLTLTSTNALKSVAKRTYLLILHFHPQFF